MQHRVIGWVVVAVVGLAIAARPAEACGVWKMQDVERSSQTLWHINSATVQKDKRKVGAFYLDVETKPGKPRVVAKREVIFDIVGDKLRKRGRAIATIKPDGSIAFGDRVYTVALTNKHDFHGAHAWDLAVARGDTPVLTSTEASPLCSFMASQKPTDAQMLEEIHHRVYFYLAWREVGAA